MKTKEQINLIPTGSAPFRIDQQTLFELQTIGTSELGNYISHQDMFLHIGEKLDNNDLNVEFDVASIEVSNKVEEVDVVKKALVKFTSDITWNHDSERMVILYSTYYKPDRFEVTYAIGFEIRSTDTLHLVSKSDIVSKSGKNLHPKELDHYLDSWLLRHEDKIEEMQKFVKKLSSVTLTLKQSHEFLGKMVQEMALNPQKICDVNVFMKALKNIKFSDNLIYKRSQDGSITLWNLYNNFTEALKEEELSTRFKKHVMISEYFLRKL